MKKLKNIIPIILVLIMLLGQAAYATEIRDFVYRDVGTPMLNSSGSNAVCKARVSYTGCSIDATLELYQGSTLVNSWHKTGTSYVSFNETEPFTSGLSYTLTLSGTVDGVAFTPVSVTKTLW